MVRSVSTVFAFVSVLFVAQVALAENGPSGTSGPDVWPDSCSCDVTFDQSFTGNYRPGEPYDVITVRPDGGGESFSQIGVRIEVVVRTRQGTPMVGVPPGEMVLWSPSLCFCDFGAHADAATDQNGRATFTGTFAAGGCAPSLDLYVEGRWICNIPVKVNSTDVGGSTSPCHTDASDLSEFASRFADPTRWTICSDFNESGPPTIDASDLAYFAAALGASCE